MTRVCLIEAAPLLCSGWPTATNQHQLPPTSTSNRTHQPTPTEPTTDPNRMQRDVAALFSVWVVREARGCAVALKRNALAAAAVAAGGLTATMQVRRWGALGERCTRPSCRPSSPAHTIHTNTHLTHTPRIKTGRLPRPHLLPRAGGHPHGLRHRGRQRRAVALGGRRAAAARAAAAGRAADGDGWVLLVWGGGGVVMEGPRGCGEGVLEGPLTR
jgi:hypothetical protein